MPRSGCSVLHGVTHNEKKKEELLFTFLAKLFIHFQQKESIKVIFGEILCEQSKA